MKTLLIAHGQGTIPYGLVDIYYYLSKKGFDVDIINLEYCSINEIKYTPDYIGITSMTIEFYGAIRIVDMVKEKWRKCKVILGGRHFARGSFTEDDEWTRHADHIVTDDGEYAIEKIITGETKDKIVVGDMLTADDYRSLPFPDKNMINSNIRSVVSNRDVRLLFSRGCPYRCLYCQSSYSRKKVINRDPVLAARYVKQLEVWFNREYVFIYDDVFTTYKQWLRDFVKEWQKQNIKTKVRCFIHGKKFDEEALDLLLSMNIDRVNLGAESGDNDVLKAINKKVTVDDYFGVADLMMRKAPNVELHCMWMLGNITETTDTMQKTIELSRRIGNTSPWFSYAIPFPGTDFWKVVDDYGTIIEKDFSKWGNRSLVFVPNGVTEEQMRYYYNRGEEVKSAFKK